MYTAFSSCLSISYFLPFPCPNFWVHYITIAIRSSKHTEHEVFYYRVPEFWRKTEKLSFLAKAGNLNHIEWIEQHADKNYTWITEGLQPEFATYLQIGTREAKAAHRGQVGGIETE